MSLTTRPATVGPGALPRLVAPRPAAPLPAALASAPPRRDPFVDAVRALGIVAVVALHWLMADAALDGETLRIGNALSHGAGWVATWLQPLPLLFFAAGAAATYRDGTVGPGDRWRRLRATALGVTRPVAALLAAWAVAAAAMLLGGVPDAVVWRLVRMVPQPLWFLGVWIVLVALTPVLLRAWRRWRWAAGAVVLALPLGVDLLRFGAGLEGVSWATLVLAWAVPFGAGVAYADDRTAGRRAAPSGRALLVTAALVVALVALAAAVLLIAVGPYPANLIGMPGDELSNLAPPTAPVVLHAVAVVCLALAVRPVVVRWATGAGRGLLSVLAGRTMTVYLWHLTAMFVVVGCVLLGLARELPPAWSIDWWAGRPTWFGAYLLVLCGLVAVFGRFESSRSGRRTLRRSSRP